MSSKQRLALAPIILVSSVLTLLISLRIRIFPIISPVVRENRVRRQRVVVGSIVGKDAYFRVSHGFAAVEKIQKLFILDAENTADMLAFRQFV